MNSTYRQTYTLHLTPQNGETRADTVSRVVGATHETIGVVSVTSRRLASGDVVTITLEGFGNMVEVADHADRFRALGAHVERD